MFTVFKSLKLNEDTRQGTHVLVVQCGTRLPIQGPLFHRARRAKTVLRAPSRIISPAESSIPRFWLLCTGLYSKTYVPGLEGLDHYIPHGMTLQVLVAPEHLWAWPGFCLSVWHLHLSLCTALPASSAVGEGEHMETP